MASIKLDDVSIIFPIFDYSTRSLRQTALRLGSSSAAPATVEALSGITVAIGDGDRVGLIGRNGSGKSTFLRVLAGVYEPTIGRIEVAGSRNSLFNVKAGMDDEASGLVNIVLLGVSAGLTLREIEKLREDILAFADLGEAIERPVRTYSAGMQLRLAFGVATAKASDIVLIDEVIGVGDANFQKKAKARLGKLMGDARILVLASHDNDVLKANCTRGLVFSGGRVVFDGPIEEALEFSKGYEA